MNPPDPIQQDLILRAQTGDPVARRIVIESLVPLAAQAARKQAEGAGRLDLLQDLASAALAGSSRGTPGAIEAIGTFDPALGSWESYAYHRALCAARSELRSYLSQPTSAELTEDNEPEGPSLSEAEIASKLDAHARHPAVTDALRLCSPRQRQVLMRAAEGASPEDIAAELGISVHRARAHLHEARIAAHERAATLLRAARLD